MKVRRIIAITFFFSFLLWAPAAFAWIPHASNIIAKRTKSIQPIELSRQSVVVAENEPDKAENGVQTTNENQDQAPASGTAHSEKRGKTPNDAASKSLKPFKPSEEIAAEQAVDFPVDI